MLLRRARVEDHDAVAALTVAAYEPFLQGRQDPYRDQLGDVAARDRDAEVWVALGGVGTTEEDRVLGAVTICPVGSPWREVSRGDDEGEFRMLAVSPAVQGRGVGRALTELVLTRFRQEGAQVVVLSSLRQMKTAHRLYERLGFGRRPDRDWSPHPGVDLVAYALEL